MVWTSFITGVMKKLCYPLPATTFTYEECYDIMSPLLFAALPYIGVNRNAPRVMVHAPHTMQGWAVPNFYVEQGLGHLQRFVETTMRTVDITGHLFKVTVEQMVLEVGTAGCPFDKPHEIWRPLATKCLVTHMWDFAERYKIQLVSATTDIPLLRHGDGMLMDFFIGQRVRAPQLLKSINRCRLYLQVARLSDLISCCGQYIRREMWEGEKLPRRNVATYDWPRQGQPTSQDWQHWRDTLTTSFGLQLPSLAVARRLQRWYISWNQWEWYQTQDELHLFQIDHANAQAHRYDWDMRYQFSKSVHYGTLKEYFPLFQVDVQEAANNINVTSCHSQPMQWEMDMILALPTMSQETYRCKRPGHFSSHTANSAITTYYNLWMPWKTREWMRYRMVHRKRIRAQQHG